MSTQPVTMMCIDYISIPPTWPASSNHQVVNGEPGWVTVGQDWQLARGQNGQPLDPFHRLQAPITGWQMRNHRELEWVVAGQDWKLESGWKMAQITG